jgi:hypothetical protein
VAEPLVTIPIPTVTGREDYLAKALEAYHAYANVETFVYKDLEGCGLAWIEGIKEGSGDYICVGADDTEFHPGWFPPAKRVIDIGHLPCARILNTDGTLQSCGPWETEMPDGHILTGEDFTRSPIFSRKQWEKLQPLVEPFLALGTIYYTDNIFTWAGRRLGMQSVVVRKFEYTHHLASVKRGGGMTWEERMQKDHGLYMDYIRSFA